MISTSSTHVVTGDSPPNHGLSSPGASAPWDELLHEFRNQLTVLLAATSELRAELSPALTLRVGDALGEAERSIQGVTSLLAVLDASLREGEAIIAPLGEIVDRAVRLAAPGAGRRATVTTKVPRGAGVRNRGGALESLLAVLIIDLARAVDRMGADTARGARVSVDAEAGRRGLLIDVTSDGAPPDAASWRFRVASDLAAKLDATLSRQPDAAGFLLPLR